MDSHNDRIGSNHAACCQITRWQLTAVMAAPHQELCTEATGRWDVKKVALAHKIGDCGIGQTSVIIAVSSAHRREALEVLCLLPPCVGHLAVSLIS